MAANVRSVTPRKRSRARRVLKWLMLIVVLLLIFFIFGVVPYFLSSVIIHASSRPSDRVATNTPGTFGCSIFQDVTFPAADGVPIAAWYLPADTSKAKGIDIVIGHGLFRSRQESVDRGVRLWKLGYGVLLMDMRHHGKSGGQISSMGYFERYDFEGGLKFLQEHDPNAQIAFMGVSMSAAASLLAAAESDHVIGVVADSTFLNFTDVVNHHAEILFDRFPWWLRVLKPLRVPIKEEFMFLAQRRGGFDAKNFDIEAAVQKIEVPIFFITGSDDDRMPPEISRRLFREESNIHKQFWMVTSKGEDPNEKATHGHAFEVEPDAYVTKVDQFLTGIRQ